MERIPFDIKYRPEIEAGKYLVETREGVSVRIICWERKGYYPPIIALLDIKASEIVYTYTEKGKYGDTGAESHLDLFLVPNPDYKEPTAEQPSVSAEPSVDWDAFRREAAKDFASAMLSNSALVDDRSWDYRLDVIKTAVFYADELIKQLKEGKK